MVESTKRRMVDAAKQSFRQRGVTATGFSEILQRSGAARGAIYHHFPGGKAELVRGVIDSTAGDVGELIDALLDQAPSPAAAVADMFDLCILAADERAGDFGCPITPAVLEADGDTDTLAAAAAAFADWQARLSERWSADGSPAETATAWSTLVVSALEGALVLARAERSGDPLRRAKHALVAMLP